MITGSTSRTIYVVGGGIDVLRACGAHDTRCYSGGKANDVLEGVNIASPADATPVRWRAFPVNTIEYGRVVLLVHFGTQQAIVLDDLDSERYDDIVTRFVVTMCANGTNFAKLDPTRTATNILRYLMMEHGLTQPVATDRREPVPA